MRQFLDPVTRTIQYLGRYEKPGYYSSTSPIIVMPGSVNAPAILIIGGRVYEKTSDMSCNLNRSGEDGLNQGTLARDTAYYLYAVIGTDNLPHLLADTRDPSTGPSGYSEWTYLGSFATYETGATLLSFNTCNGITMFDDYVSAESHTGDADATEGEYPNMPLTVKKAYGFARHNGAGALGSFVVVQATTTNTNNLLVRSQEAGHSNYSWGWVTIQTPQTVWLRVHDAATTGWFYLCGWQEDTNAYP